MPQPDCPDPGRSARSLPTFDLKPVKGRLSWLRHHVSLLYTLLLGATAIAGFLSVWPQFSSFSLPHRVLASLYATFQLFVLEGDFGGGSRIVFSVLRVMSPAVAGLGGVALLVKLMRSEFDGMRTMGYRGHVVVCGLGDKGLEVAKSARERSFHVIAVERDADNPHIREAKAKGITVLVGEAADPDVLGKARIGRSRSLFALAPDAQNARITSSAWKMLDAGMKHGSIGRRAAVPVIYSHIASYETRSLLQAREYATYEHGRPWVEIINMHDFCAKILEREMPLAPGSGRLVIVGSSPFMEALLHRVARRWVGTGCSASGRLPVDHVSSRGSEWIDSLTEKYPHLGETLELRAVARSPEAWRIPGEEEAEPWVRTISCVCVCRSSDEDTLASGIAMEGNLRRAGLQPPIRLVMTSLHGYERLLRVGDSGVRGSSLSAFGMLDSFGRLESLVATSTGVLARAFLEAAAPSAADAGSGRSRSDWRMEEAANALARLVIGRLHPHFWLRAGEGCPSEFGVPAEEQDALVRRLAEACMQETKGSEDRCRDRLPRSGEELENRIRSAFGRLRAGGYRLCRIAR